MYCGNCGKKLKENVKFCSSCGVKVEEEINEEKQVVANAFNAEVRTIDKRENKVEKFEPKVEEEKIEKVQAVVEEKLERKEEVKESIQEINKSKRKKKKSNVFGKLIIIFIIAALVYVGILYFADKIEINFIGKEKSYSYITKDGEELKYNEMEKVCVDSVKNFYNLHERGTVAINQIAYKKIEENEFVYMEYVDLETQKTNIIKLNNTYVEFDTASFKVLMGPSLTLEENAETLKSMQKKVILLKKEWEEKVNFVFVDTNKIKTIALEK